MRLQEQMAALNKKLFSASSEKQKQSKPDETQAERRKSTPPEGRREQKALPLEEVVHELDAADLVCDRGKTLCEWVGQSEDNEEVDIVQRSFVLKKHVRKKYR